MRGSHEAGDRTGSGCGIDLAGGSTRGFVRGLHPQVVGVRVGFDGKYKAGLWTPVEVILRGRCARTIPTAASASRRPTATAFPAGVFRRPNAVLVSLPPSETTVRLYVRFGRVRGWMTVEYLLDERRVGKDLQGVGGWRPEIHTFLRRLNRDRWSFAWETWRRRRKRRRPWADWTRSSGRPWRESNNLDGLPDKWYGYEGVDALVLTAAEPELYKRFTVGQLDALDQWVRMGGRLVLCVGGRADEVLGKDGVLTRFAPGRFERVVPLRQTGGLESFAGGAVAVPLAAGQSLPTPLLTDVRGRGRGPRSRFALGGSTRSRVWADIISGRRSGPAAAEPLGRRPPVDGETLGLARRTRGPERRNVARNHLRLYRHGRPVAQRPGPIRRRPPDAVLDRGGLGGRVSPLDRTGRLLLLAEDRRPDGVDVAHLPGGGVDRRRRRLRVSPSAQGRRVSRQPGRSDRRGRSLGTRPRHELDERLQSADADV